MRVAGDEFGGRNDDARGAKAALKGALLDQRLLHSRESVVFDAFEGGDLVAVHLHGEDETTPNRGSVEQHGACAAVTPLTTDLRALDAQPGSQHIEQQLSRKHIEREPFPVEPHLEFVAHGDSSDQVCSVR